MDIIEGVEAYTMAAASADGVAQELTFSKADGVLLFSDYRAFDGIMLPTRIDTSYLDDQHLGVVKRMIDVKVGVPTTDRDFLPPDR